MRNYWRVPVEINWQANIIAHGAVFVICNVDTRLSKASLNILRLWAVPVQMAHGQCSWKTSRTWYESIIKSLSCNHSWNSQPNWQWTSNFLKDNKTSFNSHLYDWTWWVSIVQALNTVLHNPLLFVSCQDFLFQEKVNELSPLPYLARAQLDFNPSLPARARYSLWQ